MEPRLPFVDEHATEIPASRSAVWEAVRSVVRRDLGGAPPKLFLDVWQLQPRTRRGDWTGSVEVGDTLPGFAVREATPGERLELRGQHRFSRYALILELDEIAGGTRVRAQTWAEFPGILGRGYRAMVIGTRMHRLVTRTLLRRVAERA